MKRIIVGMFAVLVPICVICYIAGGICNIIFGEYRYRNPNVDSSYEYDEQYYHVDRELVGANMYEFNLPVMDNLVFKLSGVNTQIMLSDSSDMIHITVKNGSAEKNIKAVISSKGGTNTIELHPTNVTFNLNPEGLISWIEDVFGDNSKCEAEIRVPEKIYNSLKIQQGSGITKITNINARYNNIDIGSGSFELIKDHRFTANEINVNLGAGKAKLYNLNTQNYNFEIGLGSFEASGLTGDGSVDIGSGSVTLSYTEFHTLNINNGIGSLELSLPSSTATRIEAHIGSGNIEVNTDNRKNIINASGDYFIGTDDTDNMLIVNNGSGNINIKSHEGNDTVDIPPISDELQDSDSGSDSEPGENSDNTSSSSSGVTGVEPLPGFENNASEYVGVEPHPDDEHTALVDIVDSDGTVWGIGNNQVIGSVCISAL